MACAFQETDAETENSIRLSILLINVGTVTVQKIIQDRLKPNKLSDILQQNKIKTKLDSFNKGRTKILIDDQYDLLYPQKGEPNLLNFDLTLLCFLYRNVLQEKPPPSTKCWNRNPMQNDLSVAADIVRLRNMRNTLYGHIVHMSMPKDVFEIKWNALQEILLRLGSSQADIDSIKQDVNLVSKNTLESIKMNLTGLIENDLEDLTAILHHLHKSVFWNKKLFFEQGSRTQELIEALTLQDLSSGENLNFKIAQVLELLSLLPNDITNTILENVNYNSEQVLAKLNSLTSLQTKHHQELISNQVCQQRQMENIQECSNNMSTSLDTIAGTLETSKQNIEQTNSKTTMIHERVLALQKQLSQTLSIDCPSAREINEYLKEKPSVLRILLFNKPEILEPHSAIKDEFGFALGSVPWDLIIDFDHCSRTKGIYTTFSTILSKKKAFMIKTYKELKEISESDKNIITDGNKALWILANGCDDIGCEPSEEKFRSIFPDIYVFLHSLLTNISKVRRSVCIINLIMSETMEKPMSDIHQALLGLCESLQERIYLDDSCALSILFDERHSCLVPKLDSDIQQLKNCMSPSQFVCVLITAFPSENMDKKFYYPGDKSMCYLTSEQMNRFQPYIELYHTDIGKIDFEGKDHNVTDELIDDIKLGFLKGNEITPEALYLNQNSICHVFVIRTEMTSIKTEAKKRLEEKEQWLKSNNRHYRGYLEIIHDASGSGTTTGKYLLYELRETYPCIYVKKIEEKTISSLSEISKASRKPLLLVVDSSNFQPSDISTFQHWLNNENVISLVVHVRRKVLSDIQSKNSKQNSLQNSGRYYISSKLTSEQDKSAFRKLFESVQHKIFANRVYLFGLIAFCEEYKRLGTHIKQCVDNMTPSQIIAVLVVCMVRQYCNSKLQVSLLRNLLCDTKNKNASLDDLLGYGADLLVFDEQEILIRPAHETIIPHFQKILEEKQTREVWMTIFIDNLCEIISKTAISNQDSLTLCHNLFIHRENPKEEKFSPLIIALQNLCGKEYTERQIVRFTELQKGSKTEDHLRGLYARYLMHCMNKREESIVQIKKAVGLETTQSINEGSNKNPRENRTLLTTYGDLFRHYGQLIFKENCKSISINSKSMQIALDMSLVYFEEAVTAYKLAQSISTINNSSPSHSSPSYKYTPHPFLGEAKTRHTVLHNGFQQLCKGKHEDLQKFIRGSNNSFLKECETEAMEALVKLETHFQHDRIHDNQVGFTQQTITELKIMLLLLRCDKYTTINKLLKTIDSKAPCDVGRLVRMDVATLGDAYIGSNKGNKRWENLGDLHLVLIIDTILNRIKKHKASALACNYEDLIVAMIHLRHKKGPTKYQQYNIHLAANLAKEWMTSFPSDYNASFYVGALLLAIGIGENNQSHIKSAIEYFVRCDELCKKHPSAQHLQKLRYALGKDTGLCMLIPYHTISDEGNELQHFFGRKIGNKTVGVRPFPGILKAVLPDYSLKNIHISSDEDPVLKFNLFLRPLYPTLTTRSNVKVASREELE